MLFGLQSKIDNLETKLDKALDARILTATPSDESKEVDYNKKAHKEKVFTLED